MSNATFKLTQQYNGVSDTVVSAYARFYEAAQDCDWTADVETFIEYAAQIITHAVKVVEEAHRRSPVKFDPTKFQRAERRLQGA